jgi:hypothetical protein
MGEFVSLIVTNPGFADNVLPGAVVQAINPQVPDCLLPSIPKRTLLVSQTKAAPVSSLRLLKINLP